MNDSRLTTALWQSIAATYQAILVHPFLRELTAGTLAEPSFRFYVVQDALYLRSFARTLSVLAGRAHEPAHTQILARHAANAIAVEQTLHADFLSEYGVSEAQLAATPLAPTCRAYTSYLEASAYGGSFAEGIAAVLPCYWIYWEVGKELEAKGSPDPRYTRWIETYVSEQFTAVVAEVLGLMDRLNAKIANDERLRVRERFATAATYEWMFWDMAYRCERWPIAAQ
jgi:thiaminase/transcriptional activator TenA